MASVLLSSITGGGSGGGLRIAPTTSYTQGNGLGSFTTVGLDISTKALVLDADGKYALSSASIGSSGTGGNLFISIEIDSVAICTDLNTGHTNANTLIWGLTDSAGNFEKSTPLLINSNIKIWLQKTGATSSSLVLDLIPLA